MGWLIAIIVFIFIIILAAISSNKKSKETEQKLKKNNIDKDNLIIVGQYIGGHPDIDNNIQRCIIYRKEEKLILCNQPTPIDYPRTISIINIENIKDIAIEDATSIEKKVTLGRVFLVGVFALAWKKKSKNEIAFLSINWNDGKFEHNTLFSFDGKDAFQAANKARNALIKVIK